MAAAKTNWCINMSGNIFELEDFDDEAAALAEAEAAAEAERLAALPPMVELTEEEFARIKQQAWQEGHTKGRAETADEQQQILHTLFTGFTEQLRTLVATDQDRQQGLEHFATRMALDTVKKLFPELAQSQALDETKAFITRTLEICNDEPTVVIRLPDDLIDDIQAMVDQLKDGSLFKGNVVLISEPTLTAAQCRIEWADGEAERNPERTLDHLDGLLTGSSETGESVNTENGGENQDVADSPVTRAYGTGLPPEEETEAVDSEALDAETSDDETQDETRQDGKAPQEPFPEQTA